MTEIPPKPKKMTEIFPKSKKWQLIDSSYVELFRGYFGHFLGYLLYDSQSTLMMRPLILMTLCHISSVLPFSWVLILELPPMSLLRFIICFSGFLVILSGPSLTCTPFLLRDVYFCMPLWLMLLWVFLHFSFDPWLRFIEVVL